MEGRLDYSKYRLEKAQDDLRTAKLLFDAKEFEAAANRSYYAFFHAMRAVLALEPFDAKNIRRSLRTLISFIYILDYLIKIFQK
ncbi:MAG: HEPN domain-containing protein [Synergistaceae bacterium]|nr:HEPN domain-containing protein [Synergistaceae bacterium]MBQ3625607.1 HEPN domain-containing protein [Synergistaceae bacterium]MBQ6739390.1 HEPN domain-containing protein [Synergistaceae bacterium]MBQ7569592.1 HEPN domain-containing protein [Synergistaceae bacterium]